METIAENKLQFSVRRFIEDWKIEAFPGETKYVCKALFFRLLLYSAWKPANEKGKTVEIHIFRREIHGGRYQATAVRQNI